MASGQAISTAGSASSPPWWWRSSPGARGQPGRSVAEGSPCPLGLGQPPILCHGYGWGDTLPAIPILLGSVFAGAAIAVPTTLLSSWPCAWDQPGPQPLSRNRR